MPRQLSRGSDAQVRAALLPQPRPGWYGLPRRLIAEHAKQVAEIRDLLGPSEKLPQHRGPVGWHGPTVAPTARMTGIRTLRSVSNECGVFPVLIPRATLSAPNVFLRSGAV